MTRAACQSEVLDPGTGIVYPSPLLGNAAKYYFADNYHQAVKMVQDIAGGLLVTSPAAEDYASADLGPLLEKYLRGEPRRADGVPFSDVPPGKRPRRLRHGWILGGDHAPRRGVSGRGAFGGSGGGRSGAVPGASREAAGIVR